MYVEITRRSRNETEGSTMWSGELAAPPQLGEIIVHETDNSVGQYRVWDVSWQISETPLRVTVATEHI